MDHSKDRDSITLDILLAVVEATHTCLPFSGGRRVGGGVNCHAELGWSEEVDTFRHTVENRRFENSLFTVTATRTH